MTPAEVKACSVWEFQSAMDGYVDANTPDDAGPTLSEDEKDELWDWMQTKPEYVN